MDPGSEMILDQNWRFPFQIPVQRTFFLIESNPQFSPIIAKALQGG